MAHVIRRSLHSTARLQGPNPLFHLAALSNARETARASQLSKLPRTAHSPSLQLLEAEASVAPLSSQPKPLADKTHSRKEQDTRACRPESDDIAYGNEEATTGLLASIKAQMSKIEANVADLKYGIDEQEETPRTNLARDSFFFCIFSVMMAGGVLTIYKIQTDELKKAHRLREAQWDIEKAKLEQQLQGHVHVTPAVLRQREQRAATRAVRRMRVQMEREKRQMIRKQKRLEDERFGSWKTWLW